MLPNWRVVSYRQVLVTSPMPVILTNQDEIETWMSAPVEEAPRLQRPLPDGALQIVATGRREDAPIETASYATCLPHPPLQLYWRCVSIPT